jgi:hypothetical protein
MASTWLATSHRQNCLKRAPASGEYTITPEDGRVRLKHVND